MPLCFLIYLLYLINLFFGDLVRYSVERGELLEIQMACFRIHRGSGDLIVGGGQPFMAREVF